MTDKLKDRWKSFTPAGRTREMYGLLKHLKRRLREDTERVAHTEKQIQECEVELGHCIDSLDKPYI